MYNTPSNTLFIGSKVIYLKSCDSTNDEAARALQDTQCIEGTTIVADVQTQGRGQQGTRWDSKGGENLTLSIVLKPTFLRAQNTFLLSMAVGLGVAQCVESIIGESVWVKWPNDVLVGSLKISGILIENTIKGYHVASSVVGIGLNVNQHQFSVPATSICLLTGSSISLGNVFERLLSCVESNYLMLRTGKEDQLRDAYLSRLLGLNSVQRFQAGREEFIGIIRGVDQSGRLEVESQGKLRLFHVKEVLQLGAVI